MATVSQPLTKKRSGKRAGGSYSGWQSLKNDLAPSPDRLNASIKIAIGAIIVTAIGETGRAEALFISLFVLISLPRDTPKQAWKAALNFVATVWSSIVVAIFLEVVAADLRWLRVLLLGFSIFFGLIIGRGLKLPLVGILSSVILSEALIRWDMSRDVNTNVEFVLWFGLMISAGVLTGTAVEYLYPHPSLLKRVVGGIAERLEALHAVLKKTAGESLSDEEEKKAEGVHKMAVSGTSSLQAFLPAISSGELLDEDYLIRLSSLLMGVEALTDLGAKLGEYSPDDFDEKQRERLAQLGGESGRLADHVRRQDTSRPTNEPEAAEVDLPDEQTPAIILSHIEFLLERLWNTWYAQGYFIGEVAKRDIHPPKSKSSSPGPFFTADNVHFAFKTAMASMICYVIYNGVDWQGISTSLVTCFIVALDTVGATFRKLALRLTGVAIGGLFFGIGGISLVLSSMTNIVELLLYVGMVFFVSGWVVKGSQRISYAGVQIGLSFALVALNTPTIPDRIVEARDRFVGVLLGAVVMWFIFRQFWPVNAIAQQRSKIAELVRDAGDLAALADADRLAEEKVDKIREIRNSGSQAIFQANEQADAAGFDSHFDAAVQDSLRDCLMKGESLLMLELIDAGFSVTHPQPHLPEEVRSARGEFATGYANYLHLVAEEITNTNGARRTEQVESKAKELREASDWLSEQLRSMQDNGDEDAKRYARIKARIYQRRADFTRQMTDGVKMLAAATEKG